VESAVHAFFSQPLPFLAALLGRVFFGSHVELGPTLVLTLVNFAILGLALLDVRRLLEKVGAQSLAEHGHSAKSLRLWAALLFPVYMFKRAKLLGQKQVHLIVWGILPAIVLVVILVGASSEIMEHRAIAAADEADKLDRRWTEKLWAATHDPAVHAVRAGTLDAYPDITLGEALENFMSDAKWESGKANDGQTYVNIKGGILYQEKPATALVQFRLDTMGSRFEPNAFEINGLPQPNILMYHALVTKAYEELQQSRSGAAKAIDVKSIDEEFKASRKEAYDKYNGKRLQLVGDVTYNECYEGHCFMVDSILCDWRESRVKRTEDGCSIVAFIGEDGKKYKVEERITFEGVVHIDMGYEDGERGPISIDDCIISTPNARRAGGDVYAGGFERNAEGGKIATVWKNGKVLWRLPAPPRWLGSDGKGSSEINALAASGSDVYAGGIRTGTGTILYEAIVWKNGEVLWSLASSSLTEGVKSLAASGPDVYAGGAEIPEYKGERPGSYAATVWWNGKALWRLGRGYGGGVTSLAVSGPDVYAVPKGLGNSAVWKNGTALWRLADNDDYGVDVRAIAASGGDVYAGGTEKKGTDVVWKNGEVLWRLDKGGSAHVSSLAVSGDDVYAGGYEYLKKEGQNGAKARIATVWKNDKPLWHLTDAPDEGADVTSIAISGNDVYYAVEKSEHEKPSASAVWKNGKPLWRLEGNCEIKTILVR
jgi:hypothetical protein